MLHCEILNKSGAAEALRCEAMQVRIRKVGRTWKCRGTQAHTQAQKHGRFEY